MGRPRCFDEDVILRRATTLFVRTGYEGTSIDGLVTALNLHRGSLYKAYGSKRGLFLAVVRHYAQVQLPAAITRALASDGGLGALPGGDALDLLLVAALERGPIDGEVADMVRLALVDIERASVAVGSSTDPPVAPMRALDLVARRLVERLHAGAQEFPALSDRTAKEN